MSDHEERIRDRAYRIWEREGKPHGRNVDHWRQAAAEVESEASAGGDDDRVNVSVADDPTRKVVETAKATSTRGGETVVKTTRVETAVGSVTQRPAARG